MEATSLYQAPPGLPQFDLAWLEGSAIPQSMQFMIDCLPTIRRLLRHEPWGSTLDVLDVGTGNGAGAYVLAMLHRADFFRVRLRVDALDIVETYAAYANAHFPVIRYLVGDVKGLPPDQSWDLVFASHVIEHVTDPLALIEALRQHARRWLLCYAPFEERTLLEGHLVSVTRSMIRRLRPVSVEIGESSAWRHPVDRISRVVRIVLRGTAKA